MDTPIRLPQDFKEFLKLLKANDAMTGRFVFVAFLLLSSLSCGTAHDPPPCKLVADTTEMSSAKIDASPNAAREILESFSDDSHIGRRGRNKIEIDIVNNGPFREYRPSNLAIVRFYSLNASNKWELSQTLELETTAIEDADPQYEDFNNDGLKDVTFISGNAARGANEVRTLLIYDQIADNLLLIRNSTSYPNLRYNRTLKCIDAFLVYGGTKTVFMKIEGDMLREFASVENFGGLRTVTTIDLDGTENIVKELNIRDDQIYDRFENFSPLLLYREK